MASGSALSRLVLWSAVAYGLSLAAMTWVGMTPTIPWAFLPVLIVVHVPLAYPLLRGPELAEGLAQRRPRAARGLACLAGGVVLGLPVLFPMLRLVLWLFMAPALIEIRRRQLGTFGDWGRILLVLFLGYAAIWNLNYLGAAAAPVLHDSLFLPMDRAVYVALLGAPAEGPLFPVLRLAWLNDLLQNAYTLLFSELFLVAALLRVRGERLVRFLVTTFAIYAVGTAAFFVFPVAGPHLTFYPELFHPELLDSPPFGAFMAGWAAEFERARAFRTENGFGYFVGLPSLHVAMALWLQHSLRISPLHYWLLLPVNVTMIASTCLLGYHWIADGIGAALAVTAVIVSRRWIEGRGRSAARRDPSYSA